MLLFFSWDTTVEKFVFWKAAGSRSFSQHFECLKLDNEESAKSASPLETHDSAALIGNEPKLNKLERLFKM